MLGRNQKALTLIILNKSLCLSYNQILSVMQEKSLPYLIRARYLNLMGHLFVDRDPQTPVFAVNNTRLWSKCSPQESDIQDAKHEQGTIPVCPDEFEFVQAYLIRELPNLADCTDINGNPSFNGDPTFGQLEMVKSMLSLVELLLEFGFFRKNLRDWEMHKKLTRAEKSWENCQGILKEHAKKSFTNVKITAHLSTETQVIPRCSTDIQFDLIKQLCRSFYTILEPRRKVQPSDEYQVLDDYNCTEARLRNDVRTDTLMLLLRLYDLRLNERISFCIDAWEQVFEKMSSENRLSVLNVSAAPMSVQSIGSHEGTEDPAKSRMVSETSLMELKRDGLNNMFMGCEEVFEKLKHRAFGENTISPHDISCDIFHEGNYEDTTVQILLDLTNFKHRNMTRHAISMLIRHMSQRPTLVEGLQNVQILVFPAAAKVFVETKIIIVKLSEMQKRIAYNDQAAYDEASLLLDRMTEYLKESCENKPEIVTKNQNIMINLGIHTPIRTLLKIFLGRDTTQADAGEMEADIALNIPLRELFQKCYIFLKSLTKGNARVQATLFPFVETWSSEHMGIKELNVADTLAECVRDNSRLCMRVGERFYRIFIQAIKRWGRRARWLSFFQVLTV